MPDDLYAQIRLAAEMVVHAKWPIALTGAGISVDSGIPDFRSPGGLWTKYDPMEYATIDAFDENPSRVWTMLKDLGNLVITAEPNPGHTGLAELEKMGRLKSIITQNIDDLHQSAGSKKVIEFHGNGNTMLCRQCGGKWTAQEADEMSRQRHVWPPECPSCAEILKPDIVFFGEAIPQRALIDAQSEASKSDLILVLGTSATVAPASHIPLITNQNGGKIIEFNLMQTALSSMADMTILGNASVTVPSLVEAVRALI